MKKILLTVAMLLSAAGMQGLSTAWAGLSPQQKQGQYGVISGAYPTNVNVAPGDKAILKAPTLGFLPNSSSAPAQSHGGAVGTSMKYVPNAG